MARTGHGGPGTLRVGTSGWAYRHWTRFYAAGLKPAAHLTHYSGHFSTVEVNTSFYHLPLAATFDKWAAETPSGFLFALKLSRYITHMKKLSGVKVATRRFLERAGRLRTKLGPVLVQLPPHWKADPKRLERFLLSTRAAASELRLRRLRLAFEFRHETWFRSDESLSVLKRYGAAIVFGHSSRYPYPESEPRTARWTYLRFHGPRELFGSEYRREGLLPWAEKVARWLAEGTDVYAYFNNDAHEYAIDDARRLAELVAERAASAD